MLSHAPGPKLQTLNIADCSCAPMVQAANATCPALAVHGGVWRGQLNMSSVLAQVLGGNDHRK